MPTPAGLPKAGETWKRTTKGPPDWKPHITVFKVIRRGAGSYWAMRVRVISIDGQPPRRNKPQLWVDCAYWFSKGELEYISNGKEPA